MYVSQKLQIQNIRNIIRQTWPKIKLRSCSITDHHIGNTIGNIQTPINQDRDSRNPGISMLEFSTPPSAHHILHAYTPPTTSSQWLTSQCTYWLPHSPFLILASLAFPHNLPDPCSALSVPASSRRGDVANNSTCYMICPRRLISCDDFLQQFSFSTDWDKVLRFMATVLTFFFDTYYRVLGLFMGCAPSRNVNEKMDMADDGSNSNCTNCVGCTSTSAAGPHTSTSWRQDTDLMGFA